MRLSPDAHVFAIEVQFESVVAGISNMKFCAGCGRPDTPALRGKACKPKPPGEVKELVKKRVGLLQAIVGGHEPTNKRNRGKGDR